MEKNDAGVERVNQAKKKGPGFFTSLILTLFALNNPLQTLLMSEYLAPKNEDGSKSKAPNFMASAANTAILVYAALAVIFGLLLAVSFGDAYFNLF